MLSGSTTGASQPSTVKCGVCANADEEGDGEEVVEEEGEEGETVADVPFVAKRAMRVRSACARNVLLPVRSARW